MNEDLLPVPTLIDPMEDYTYGKYRIAMVIGDMVHQVLVLDAPEAARYLSEPVFIQIPRTLFVTPGDTYTNNTFIPRK